MREGLILTIPTNTTVLIHDEAFRREIERFVNPSSPVSKQVALDNIVVMVEKRNVRN